MRGHEPCATNTKVPVDDDMDGNVAVYDKCRWRSTLDDVHMYFSAHVYE